MTTTPINPQALPQGNAHFIAYGPVTRTASPAGDGTSVTVRPQVFVRYYSKVVLLSVGSGRGAHETIRVDIDPESAGLSEKIGGYLDPNDPLVEYARQRAEEKVPVDVAIEYVRRSKTKGEKATISPLVPIHALRGAKNPDGSGDAPDMMAASGKNISVRIAMIAGRPAAGRTSNPDEGAPLPANRDGSLAPEGYRRVASEGDWTQMMVVVPTGEPAARATAQGAPATPAPTGPLPAAGDIAAILRTVLIEAGVIDPPEAEAAASRSASPRRFNEGKPWAARTNDGRINLGSYQVTNVGYAARWAHEHLTEQGVEHPDHETVWTLTDRILSIADHVQADAYGRGVKPDRGASSHREATLWVQWVAAKGGLPYPLDGEGDLEETRTAWMRAVHEAAVANLRRAGESAAAHLQAARAARPTTPPRGTPVVEQPAGPAPAVVKALLDTVARSWADRNALANLATEARNRGFGDLRVEVDDSGDKPVFTYPAEGSDAATIVDVLHARWIDLDAESSSEGDPKAPTGSQGTAEDPLAALATALRGENDEIRVRSLYNEAKRKNLLNATLYASFGETVTVTVEPHDGASRLTVAALLNALRERGRGTATATEAPDGAPTAQQIADAADAATDSETVVGLIAQAEAHNLSATVVSVRGATGPLSGWLKHRADALTPATA